MDVKRLEHIVSYISDWHCCCDIRDFVCAAVQNNWSDEVLANPRSCDYKTSWSFFSYSLTDGMHKLECSMENNKISEHNTTTDSDTIYTKIASALERCNYISLYVEADMSKCLDHSMMIFITNEGIKCTDGYVQHRNAGIRDFDMVWVKNFIVNPVIGNWNILCDSEESCYINDGFIGIELGSPV